MSPAKAPGAPAPATRAARAGATARLDRPLWLDLVRLARPKQWAKSVFVIVGPAYAFMDGTPVPWAAVAGAVLAFGFASSACYVVNDLRDRESDRLHPRKRLRPVASGAVSPGVALIFGLALLVLATASIGVVAAWGPAGAALWLGIAVAAYILNVTLYSMGLKRAVIIDVISLAAGFVLRVVGGCAAAGVEPSSWLLNCTFFVSMFLAFGKRLGERRTMGGDAAAVRGVQTAYTDELLRMAVVVTGVASLLTYAGYVQAQSDRFRFLAYPGDAAAEGSGFGLNLLWLTVLPATYALLRCIVLIERGDYDDPTELASRDRPFQAAAALFAAILGVLVFAGPSAG